MWKKDEASEATPESPRSEATPPRNDPPRTRMATGPGETATIGRSITIRGEVTGDEDLLIQGKVDGSVDLKQHSVTVGPEGQVKAGISGRVVTVEGTVEGDLQAQEQVILRSNARVEGDITAPRVVLEDGATFRGGVDMGDGPKDGSVKDGSVSSTPRTKGREARSDASGNGPGSVTAAEKSGGTSSNEATKDRAGKATGATT